MMVMRGTGLGRKGNVSREMQHREGLPMTLRETESVSDAQEDR